MAKAQPARLFDDSFLRFLPPPVREPRRLWLALLTSWVLTMGGSLVLAVLTQMLLPALDAPSVPNLPPWLIIGAFVFVAPLLESIAMAAALVLLARWLQPAQAVLVSAIGWGFLHSLQASGWGLAIWWPFLIFSMLFLVWRQRGFWTGVGVATAAHMLQNLGPAIALIYRN